MAIYGQRDLEGVKLPYKWLAVESLNDAMIRPMWYIAI